MNITRAAIAGITLAALSFAQTPPAPSHGPRARSATTSRAIGRQGYLGVGVVELTAERAKALRVPDLPGVEVKRVDENSPAWRAGLKENDVILEVNGQKLDDVEDFIRTIGDNAPGTKVGLTVWRDAAKHSLSATLQARAIPSFALNESDMPAMPPMPEIGGPWGPVFAGQSPRVGFEGETLTAQLAEYFGVKDGVLVRSVSAKTPAEKAGLRAGDVITKLNGTPVTTPREITSLVRAGKRTFTFTVVRNHKEITLNVEVAGLPLPSPDREVL